MSIEDYERITRSFDSHTARLVESLGRLDNKDWVPPLLFHLKQHADKEDVDVSHFVRKLERLAYFLFVARADVNTRMARYADVLNEIDPRSERTSRLSGLNLEAPELFDMFTALDGQIYLKNRVVKPLLLRLDFSLSDGSASYVFPTISVEHVCPQTIEPGSQWDAWFSNTDEHAQWLHRLSNLVLLTRRKNEGASNWDFPRKKTTYFMKSDACPFLLTSQVLDES